MSLFYCVKCKEKVEGAGTSHLTVTKNRRLHLRDKCSVCGTNVGKIQGRKDVADYDATLDKLTAELHT